MTSCRSFADLELLHLSSARAPTRRRPHTPTRLPYPVQRSIHSRRFS